MKIAFFDVGEGEAEYLRERLAGHEIAFFNDALDRDHLPETLDFEAVSVLTSSRVDRDVIEALPKLAHIFARSTGYDHIDCEAARERGIAVCTVPGYGEHTVAEYAFALLLAVSRKIYQAYDRVRETGSFNLTGLCGSDLFGKTIGVVGTGRIGTQVIRIARGFGMEVIAHDASPRAELEGELGFTYVSFSELLERADVITLHVPSHSSTKHLINRDTIRGVKRGCILINTARGDVVETEALVTALDEGILAGVGLDVLEEEGVMREEVELLAHGHPEEHNLRAVIANHALIDMENAIVTPHNAFNTKEALERILTETVENIRACAEGKPRNAVS